MLSSGYYIQSGFNEIDNPTNDVVTDIVQKTEIGLQGIVSWFNGLNDEAKVVQDKLSAMLYMTVSYYQKTDVAVTKTETQLGDVSDINTAQTVLIAQKCQSSYIDFMGKVEELKSKYDTGSDYTDSVYTNQQEWQNIVKQYDEARNELVKDMDVYTSIKYAFLYGMGIDLCSGSASPDQKLLVCKLIIMVLSV